MKPQTYLLCKSIEYAYSRHYTHIDKNTLISALMANGIRESDAISYVTKPLPADSMESCMDKVNSEHPDWAHDQKIAVCLNVTGQSKKAEYSDPDEDGDDDSNPEEDPDRHSDEDKKQRAKQNDLIVLPDDVEGTNCGNCKFFSDNYCQNKDVDQEVNPRMCCALWDNDGVDRSETQGQ